MAFVNLWIIDEDIYGDTPYTETITKGHELTNNEGEKYYFSIDKRQI